MVLKTNPTTIDEFREFVSQPENSDRLFELINGEIVEVSPGRTSNSGIGHLIAFEARLFCREHRILCYTSGGDGAYEVQGHVVAPDFAFKRTPLSDDYPDPVAPEWAVEIVSPTDKPYEVRAKRQIYLQAKILYWELYPLSQTIDVYPPGQPPRTYGIDDTLDGGDVLPGFTLLVKKYLMRTANRYPCILEVANCNTQIVFPRLHQQTPDRAAWPDHRPRARIHCYMARRVRKRSKL